MILKSRNWSIILFSYEFEVDTPFNFREFIAMVHINDGMLAITSDAIAYLIKFNYDNVLSR